MPGLDSQQATELLAAAGVGPGRADRPGGRDPAATSARRSSTRRTRAAALADLQAGAARCRTCSDDDPPDARGRGRGRVAPRRPRRADPRCSTRCSRSCAPSDLEQPQGVRRRGRGGSPLRIEMGGDLFFAFEEPETGVGELIGLLAAVVILLLAFGSLIAMGLPIGMARVRARPRRQLDVAGRLPHRHPQLGAACSAAWSASASASTTPCSSSPGTASTSLAA